jgi:uncharacterized protein
MRRRDFLSGLTAGVSIAAAAPMLHAAPTQRGSAKGLAEPAFRPLPLGAIQAEGWLQRQLRIQANGLSGHLDQFWPDVADSQWFGGKAEGWERAPYWLDGFVPLAWVLNDDDLKARARKRVEAIVNGQRADGWYAPFPQDANARPYDLWAILLVNKVLVQYHEATGDAATLEAVSRNLKAVHSLLDRIPLFAWGKARWFEGLIPVFYLFERTGESWLMDLAGKLHAQGFDYAAFYRGEDIKSPTPRRGLWTMEKHVVNTAMAIKAGALKWRLTRDNQDAQFARRAIELLDRYHGQANGMFSGDECLSGRNPVQGTELCAVVEMMYSLEQVIAAGGDPWFGDRLERITFNALPATFSPDMWCHQYDQQANQVQCTINHEQMWSTNGPESNLYGLEPNFGCCTANMHQGWPKFASHLWMRTPKEGIAAIAYAPSRARFVSHGVPVEVQLETDYPFREELRFTVRTERPVRFPLLLRVPAWAIEPRLSVGSDKPRVVEAGAFAPVDRKWTGTTHLALRLPMKPQVTRRYNRALSIERGPLVYSLQIGEEWKRVNADKPHRELPHADYEVRPTTPWNYGLAINERDLSASVTFEERPVGERPFSPEGAGMRAKVKGKKLESWKLAHGWAAEVQPQPQSSKEALEEVTLLPYGCTNLRVTEFPGLADKS